MNSSDIRKGFFKYFGKNKHEEIKSSSLLPEDDPTLLFTNAGMVQFKKVFTGEDTRPYSRAATCQKCMRAGGKHNDLENVGQTSRHHTFFEMLGNFSFGDYFKEGAIEYAWEFLTKEMRLPEDKLYATVFTEDDDAEKIWQNKIKLPISRIKRLGEKDNFWSMGDTGPCGPCSEILIDQGEGVGCGRAACSIGCDCDRFLEIWNLVFMQFERDSHGKLTPLPKPSIDTGMGLERLSAVVQGKKSNYDSDLFTPIIGAVESISGVKYGKNNDTDTSIRAIADHARATAFLIADGLLPSNDGRGYVLRRILRRAVRHGSFIGIKEPFFHKTASTVADTMAATYPELKRSIETITNSIRSEEERFLETLERGISILSEEVDALKKAKKKTLPGSFAFKLYDTYGFPVDLTADILKKDNMTIDEDAFTLEMEKQKSQARLSWKGTRDAQADAEAYKILSSLGLTTRFNGYHVTVAPSKISAIIKDSKTVNIASTGDEVIITTEESPFYPEGGGQTGDTGLIISKNKASARVVDTKKASDTLIAHHCVIEEGSFSKGDDVELIPDKVRRDASCRNHTATHLLHSALRELLGKHVRQAGSLVTPEGFRFDFSHFSSLGKDDLRKIEERVNAGIRENIRVSTEILPHAKAIEKGALAFFGEKYGDTVRLVSVPGISAELCGGTHVSATGDIGLIKITSEGSVASGVRRIEAKTGEAAIKELNATEDMLLQVASLLKGSKADVLEKVTKLIEQQKQLEREIARSKQNAQAGGTTELIARTKDIAGVKALCVKAAASSAEELRTISDAIRVKLGSGVVVLGAESDGKAILLACVTKDLTAKISAGEIIKRIAPTVGGKGGGKPDMAQAGGKDASGLDEALKAAEAVIKELAAK